MLSCRILPVDTATDQACCLLAPFHQEVGLGRARRYPSDTTDTQWLMIDPLLPDPAWLAGQGERREVHCRRVIVDAIFYVVDNGIKWRALPVDFPPWSTVYNYERLPAHQEAMVRWSMIRITSQRFTKPI